MRKEFITPMVLGIIVAFFVSFKWIIPFFNQLGRSHPLAIGMAILSIIAIPFLLRELIKLVND